MQLAVCWELQSSGGSAKGIKKSKPLWKQGPQPKLTAYEKIDYLLYINRKSDAKTQSFLSQHLILRTQSSLKV
ncbi:MAG: hypothetical protein JWN76_92 [Chitinophagaceae bacterium]|nr:hypothetical protein [Chitinophagaceae bacterium]